MSAAVRHRVPGATTSADFRRSPEDDRAEPYFPSIQRMYDEAMARAAVHPRIPLQRYLAVLAAAT